MNVTDHEFETVTDHERPEECQPVIIWGNGSGGESAAASDSHSAADGDTDSGNGGGRSVGGLRADEAKQPKKRGRPKGSANAAVGKADERAELRRRLRGQLTLVVLFLFAKYGGWRAKKWERVSPGLSEKIKEIYYITDEAAEKVAEPAANLTCRYLPTETVGVVCDTLDPINLITTVQEILSEAERREKREILDWQSHVQSRTRKSRPIEGPTDGFGHVDEHVYEGARG